MESKTEDNALIQTVIAGQTAAFEQLVTKYQQSVYHLAYRMLGNSAEAEDGAQESFLRAYLNLHRYTPEYSFRAWLLRITANYCIDRIRQRAKIAFSLDDSDDDHWEDRAPQPEHLVIRQEQHDQIQWALSKLPPKERLLVTLHYWQEASYDEIAVITQSSVSSVKSRLYRARVALAQHLSQPNPQPLPAAITL